MIISAGILPYARPSDGAREAGRERGFDLDSAGPLLAAIIVMAASPDRIQKAIEKPATRAERYYSACRGMLGVSGQ